MMAVVKQHHSFYQPPPLSRREKELSFGLPNLSRKPTFGYTRLRFRRISQSRSQDGNEDLFWQWDGVPFHATCLGGFVGDFIEIGLLDTVMG